MAALSSINEIQKNKKSITGATECIAIGRQHKA